MTGRLFRYTSFAIDEQDTSTVRFLFELETEHETYAFTEHLRFPIPISASGEMNRALQGLHLALGISYYKTCLPKEIEQPYRLTPEEAHFWNTVYAEGLGEFLLKNNRSIDDVAQFSGQNDSTDNNSFLEDSSFEQKALLGIGGGKDSIVAGELLKSLDIPVEGFVLATGRNRGQAQAVADVMQVPLHGVERTLDPQLLELNKQPGILNGHVPISVIFAFIGVILGLAKKSRYVIVANESSASIPQAKYNGLAVNHQWSKSLEFERLFQGYVQKYISPNVQYFSVVRQLSSVAIAKLFSRYRDYFEVFTSDNSVFKVNRDKNIHNLWSFDSPKSLSSFILLAPWLGDEDLMRIFGINFLDQPQLEQLFWNLLGKGSNKVLDCVGTPEELNLSIHLLMQQNRFSEAHLLRQYTAQQSDTELLTTNLERALALNVEHALPEELEQRITNRLEEDLK